jgi:S1-C subfamily serine protease
MPLVTSQAVVLRDIVTQIYIAGETYPGEDAGFLGVRLASARFGMGDDPLASITRGAPVLARIPGFGAFRMLNDGDVILALGQIGNQPRIEVNNADELIAAVKSVAPGETITLEVLRRGRVIEVPLTLGRRPIGIEGIGALDEFTNRRLDRAEAMWKKEFAPLLEDSVG